MCDSTCSALNCSTVQLFPLSSDNPTISGKAQMARANKAGLNHLFVTMVRCQCLYCLKTFASMPASPWRVHTRVGIGLLAQHPANCAAPTSQHRFLGRSADEHAQRTAGLIAPRAYATLHGRETWSKTAAWLEDIRIPLHASLYEKIPNWDASC